MDWKNPYKKIQVLECFFRFWLPCWPAVTLLEKFWSHLEGVDKHKRYNASAAQNGCLNIPYLMARMRQLPTIFINSQGALFFEG